MSVKFSILIPAYKKPFLKDAIYSCLKQAVKDLEVVIIDDCSPEDLGAIVSGFDDERIRYYRNESNIGALNVVDNWNKCLSLCTGEYVICMGDDDKLLPNCLEEYMQLIERYPSLDVYHARTATIDEQGTYIDIVPSRCEYENLLEFMRHRLEGWNQFIGDFCYRTSVLKEMGGFYKKPLAWGSDDITAFKMIGNKGIANTQEITFLYRCNSRSISSASFTDTKLLANVETFRWIGSFLDGFKCSTIEERLTHDILKSRLHEYKQDYQAAILCQCFKEKKRKCISYFFHRKKYEVFYSTILKALFSSMLR